MKKIMMKLLAIGCLIYGFTLLSMMPSVRLGEPLSVGQMAYDMGQDAYSWGSQKLNNLYNRLPSAWYWPGYASGLYGAGIVANRLMNPLDATKLIEDYASSPGGQKALSAVKDLLGTMPVHERLRYIEDLAKQVGINGQLLNDPMSEAAKDLWLYLNTEKAKYLVDFVRGGAYMAAAVPLLVNPYVVRKVYGVYRSGQKRAAWSDFINDKIGPYAQGQHKVITPQDWVQKLAELETLTYQDKDGLLTALKDNWNLFISALSGKSQEIRNKVPASLLNDIINEINSTYLTGVVDERIMLNDI